MRYDHDEIKVLLHDYIHGRLANGKQAMVKAHLLDCDDCNDELIVAEALLEIEAPEPARDYFESITKSIVSSARTDAPKRFNLWQHIFRPFPIAAAAALCLMLITFGYIHHGPPIPVTMQNDILSETGTAVIVAASDDTLYSLIGEEYGDEDTAAAF